MSYKFVKGKEKKVKQAGFEQLVLSFDDEAKRDMASTLLSGNDFKIETHGQRYLKLIVPVPEAAQNLHSSKRIKACEDLVENLLNEPETELPKLTQPNKPERFVPNKIILVRLKHDIGLHMTGAAQKLSEHFSIIPSSQIRQISPQNTSILNYFIWEFQLELSQLVEETKITSADNSEARRKKIALKISSLLLEYTPKFKIRVSEKEINLPQTPPESKTPKQKKIKPNQPKQDKPKATLAQPLPDIIQTQKHERKHLGAAILQDLTCQPNKNPSRETCISKLIKTTDGIVFLIMWGGSDEKHANRRGQIPSSSIGQISSTKTIPNNGQGDLNCSIFQMNGNVINAIIQKYSQQKNKEKKEKKAAEPPKFAKGTLTPTGLNALQKEEPHPSLFPAGYARPKLSGAAAILAAKQLETGEPPLEEIQVKVPHKEPKPRAPQPQRNGLITNLLHDSTTLLERTPDFVKQLFTTSVKTPMP